ncbi:CPBP family intramembrane glutamic endopeptidase [Rossellomorea aquimaris]|uniref:CPBP family intramembrane glutamic endopeptidase n=1 Tax=Rossellomorea aquimaris TaxID=189382 RepID=UPI0007D05768|nr:type II CAAX endopeptidase family protein [Rossellomorea aquimaris]
MVKRISLLLGPTIMIFLGIQIYQNVPLTFILFYGWLAFFPMIEIMRKTYIPTLLELKREQMVVGLMSGLVAFILIFGSAFFLLNHFFEVQSVKQLLNDWGFSGHYNWYLVVFLIVLNPIFEEIYWRDYMLNKLRVTISMRKVVLITSFFYCLYHLLTLIPLMNWPLNIFAVIPVFLGGVIWAYFRLKFNSISTSILSHSLADGGIMFVYIIFLN